MVKGCSKRVIVLKNTKSEMIDEAYFILKDRALMPRFRHDRELVEEANRIITDSILVGRQHDRKRRVFMRGSFFAGMGLGAVTASLISIFVF